MKNEKLDKYNKYNPHFNPYLIVEKSTGRIVHCVDADVRESHSYKDLINPYKLCPFMNEADYMERKEMIYNYLKRYEVFDFPNK